jgi:hypothetical protein
VDNRVEAPTWAPDGGSDGATPGEESDETSALTSDSADGAGSAPHVSNGMAADDGEPAAQDLAAGPAAHEGQFPNPAASPLTQKSTLVGTGGNQRGLAARVTAPFAVLARPRPKSGQVRKKPAPRGNGSGLPPPGPRPQPRLTAGPATGPQTRRAQLRLDRIEPWSVMKFSFLMSLIGWVILFVAVSVLYFALSKLGVFTSIEHTVTLVTGNKTNPAGSNPGNWFKASRVLGYTMLVGAVNVILLTALATVGAVLYNLVTMLAGGIEVTLKESD